MNRELILIDPRFRSKTLQKYCEMAFYTDLANITGGDTHNFYHRNYMITGVYCTMEPNSDETGPKVIDAYGYACDGKSRSVDYAIRPILVLHGDEFRRAIFGKTLNDDGEYEVEYGEYPQFAANFKLQEKLENLFQQNLLQKTGRFFTFNSPKTSRPDCGFFPHQYEEYQYQDKRYIRVCAKFHSKARSRYQRLSNDIRYDDGDYVWIEVSPVKWIVKEEFGYLISKNCLLSGIRFNSSKKYREYTFSSTEMYKYMNKYMLNELLQGIKNINDLDKENPEDIPELLKTIEIYKEFYYGTEDIDKEIEALINEYNDNLDKIIAAGKSTIFDLELPNEKVLSINLTIKLNNILTKLRTCYEENKKYLDMIDILNSLKNILVNGNGQDIDNELIKDIKLINFKILTFLNIKERNKIQDQLLNVINKHNDKILNYLKSLKIFSDNDKKKIEYNNLHEFELAFRKDINPILVKLGFYVERKDLISEISSKIKDSIGGIYNDSNNKQVSIYLNSISDILVRISDKLSDVIDKEYYERKMSKILDIELDYDMDNSTIYELLLGIYSKLYGLELELDKEIAIANYKVRVRQKI